MKNMIMKKKKMYAKEFLNMQNKGEKLLKSY